MVGGLDERKEELLPDTGNIPRNWERIIILKIRVYASLYLFFIFSSLNLHCIFMLKVFLPLITFVLFYYYFLLILLLLSISSFFTHLQ